MTRVPKSLAAFVILALPALAQTAAPKDWSQHVGKVPFVIGYEAGMAQAAKGSKPAMLFVTSARCVWRKRLAAESFTDDGIVSALEAFVPVLVDGEDEPDVVQRLDVAGYPDVRFVNTDGTALGHVAGYVPKAEFRSAIDEALSRAATASAVGEALGRAAAALDPSSNTGAGSETPAPVVFDAAEAARGLAVGDAVPAVTLRTMDGEPFDLRAAIEARPTVLVFYRGGWCPYCNRHLSELATIEGELRAMGFQILALSPDLPEAVARTAASEPLGYTLLSDAGHEAARRFALAFRLDAATVGKYEGMGMDLSPQQWTLPVPAAFVIGTDGKIAFAHVDPDYKRRIANADIIDAARRVLADGESDHHGEHPGER